MIKANFATVEKLLLELGFQQHPVPGTHLLYEHPEAKVRIALRPYQPTDTVEPIVLAYIRGTLDGWSILERDEFEERLRERSRAS
jgi:predicted RNA binding protein YcfA (HicA-like mRNA interferase family)